MIHISILKLKKNLNSRKEMESLPAELIVLILERCCLEGGILHAGKSLAAFIRTCKKVRDVAYSKFMSRVFDARAIHQCEIGYYRTVIGTKHKKNHLGFVANNDNLPITLHIMRTATKEYLRQELQYVVFRLLTPWMVKILVTNREYFEGIKTAAPLMNNQFKVYKILFKTRDLLYPDATIIGVSTAAYAVAIRESLLEFVRKFLQEDRKDVRCYAESVKNILHYISDYGPVHPWLNRTPAVELFDEVIADGNFQKTWLEEILSGISITYRAYMTIRYGLQKKPFHMDETTLNYYLSADLSYIEIAQLMLRNGNHTEIILKSKNVLKLNVPDRVGIARRALTYMPVYKVLDILSLEPSNDFWLSEGYFDVLPQCFVNGLDADETAIVKLYVEDEAAKHRQIVKNKLAGTDTKDSGTKDLMSWFEIWAESRIAERWSIEKNIERFIAEREDGIREQREIDAEQSKIQLNWSQEHYCVPEWSDDIRYIETDSDSE